MTAKTEVPERHWDAMFAPSSILTMITTASASGRVNAATFGTCTRVSHDPVYLLFALTAIPESDTCANIAETGQFVVNAVPFDEQLLDKARVVGLPFAPGINELARAGLTAIPSMRVSPPRISECTTHFECEVAWTHSFDHRMIVCGRVVAVSIDENCYEARGVINWDQVRPAHYSGSPYGGNFVSMSKPFHVGRTYDGPPDWRDGTPDLVDLPDILANPQQSVEFGRRVDGRRPGLA